MARSLDAIIQELDAGYNPSRQAINEKVAGLPAQYQAEEKGLQAQEKDYFTNTILGGARERGVAFGGIPEGERAQYGASTYLPALARLKTAQTEQQGSLMESLNSLNREQRGQASGIYQGELNRDEQIRQFNESLAAQERQAKAARAATATPTTGQLPNGGTDNSRPHIVPRAQGGFDFKSAKGQPISAATYANLAGVPIGKLLYDMGQKGDKYAQQAYDHIKQYADMGMTNIGPGLKSRYSAIFWGT